MVFTEKRHVVRRWPGEGTASGGFVEDNQGRVWRILDSWESPNSMGNTTGAEVRKLTRSGEIK